MSSTKKEYSGRRSFDEGCQLVRSACGRPWWLAVLGWTIASTAGASPPGIHFNRDVRPILSEYCFECHGPDRARAGLRLDDRDYAIEEGESGLRAIVPGHPDQSELLVRVTSEDPEYVMPQPKSGKKLKPGEIEVLREWIAQGGEYEAHWAFLPPVGEELPVLDGVSHPVDRLVRDRLQKEGITPSPEADRATLIRRATLDLTGLPPTPVEVDAFINDGRPDAFERVVDRLLNSVHFGEKWARWWLDLAHYGDSDGIRLDNFRPYAWRYRQWVVDSLNRDLPFDQFTIQQLAGDLLPDATTSQRMGTGFLRNTISDRQTGNANPEIGRVRQIVDRTATVGTVWMGLTVGCAECHDHKFDPISQREFFQLYSFFNDAEEMNINAPLPGEWEPHVKARKKYEVERAALLAPLATPLAGLQAAWEEKMLFTEANPGADHHWGRAFEILVTSWGRGKGEGQWEGLTIIKTPPDRRTPEQTERLQDYFLKYGKIIDPEKFKELKVAELSKALEALAKSVPPVTRAQTMTQAPVPRTTRIHTRGDFRRPGDPVEHDTPAILPPLEADGRPDRLDLARWLVSQDNPLTARVAVNRLWQELFGKGLVGSSDNFGMRGEYPSHPELLDWLATEFMENGWSMKRMLRVMMTSATYRQSSKARPDLDLQDPGNRFLARQTRLRLSAEGVRDTSLAVGGLLNLTVGGPSVRPPQPESLVKENTRNPWVADKGPAIYRRGLYTFIHRLTPFAQFANFDLPGTASACTQRERSNTPLQALNLLNDPAFMEAAQALADRICREEQGGFEARIARAFLLTLARAPSDVEVRNLEDYFERQTSLFEHEDGSAQKIIPDPLPAATLPESAAWVMVSSVLLNLDEFINRE